MFLLHSKSLPKADAFFEAAFGVDPDEIAFFPSPVGAGWTGSSLRGAIFHVLAAGQYDRERFEELFSDRPLRVLHCQMALAQDDDTRAFLCEALLPMLANAVDGIVFDGTAVVHRGGEGPSPSVGLVEKLRVVSGADPAADDWSDL